MPETLETPIVYFEDDNVQASTATPMGNEGVESPPRTYPDWYVNTWVLGRSLLGTATYLGFGEQ